MTAKVWIVDDDSSIRWVLERTLGSEGFECESFADGEALLSSLEMRSPDVILSDIRMPGIDGLSLQKKLGDQGADVAFECTSVNKVLDQLVAATKPGGVVVIVSIWSHPATINVHSVVMKELDVRGTIAYCNDHRETIKLVEQGKIDLEPFITQRIQLDDLVSQGFDTLIHNNESAVKIIVQPRLK